MGARISNVSHDLLEDSHKDGDTINIYTILILYFMDSK